MSKDLLLKLKRKNINREQNSLETMLKLRKKRTTRPSAEFLKIDNKLAQNYVAALNSLGIGDVRLDSFEIDKRGFSQEIGKIIGPNYLDGAIIIVCPEQGALELNDFTLDALINEFFSKNIKAIESITPNEALFSRIEGNLAYIFAGSKARLCIKTAFETPNNSIKRLSVIKEGLERINQQPELLLCDSFISPVAAESAAISTIYKKSDIESLLSNRIQQVELYPDIAKLSMKEADVYYFSEPQLLICFPKSNIVLAKQVIDGRDANRVLEALYDNELITFNENIVRKYIVAGKNEYIKILEHIKAMGERACFYELSPQMKAELSQPRCLNRKAELLVEEILAHVKSNGLYR